MSTRREVVAVLTGTAASLSMQAAAATTTAKPKPAAVKPAKLERPANRTGRIPFIPAGEARTFPVDYDYIEEEWFASGVDDLGHSYVTQVVVRRPRDPKRFSGVLITEPLHASRVAPIYMYSSRHILRSGHAWACIASQKTALDDWVKKADPEHYAALHIEAAAAPPAASAAPGTPDDTARVAAMIARMETVNQASNVILAQVGAALRTQGPLAGYDVRHVLLVGHSQTGFVSASYIQKGHEKYRRVGGASVFDGYFPSGNPGALYGPRDVPLIQVLSDGDVAETSSFLLRGRGRVYRRPDSDDPKDRYRLYEFAGVPHMGTRNPPNSDPKPWSERNPGVIKPDTVMNSLPHNELFNMALNHLVLWVARGVTPPRADRIEVGSDGNAFARDEHGNSRGGIRCVQMDVPRAMSIPNPRNADGSLLYGTFGFEVPFDKAKMQMLYGTPARYVERFNRRLEELIRQGWFLGADATSMRDEALSQLF
jgi:hypothetical protein